MYVLLATAENEGTPTPSDNCLHVTGTNTDREIFPASPNDEENKAGYCLILKSDLPSNSQTHRRLPKLFGD